MLAAALPRRPRRRRDGTTRGLYKYDGQWYFVSLSYRDAEAPQDAEDGHTQENETEHTH